VEPEIATRLAQNSLQCKKHLEKKNISLPEKDEY
jgi:hypothetical protein